ncbi:hypothetical protein [Marinobacter sp.]|uniref:hypothetical protein n=1 Tax=Marinobacter sp. TaxID=50741 RepID=UPI003A8D7DAF
MPRYPLYSALILSSLGQAIFSSYALAEPENQRVMFTPNRVCRVAVEPYISAFQNAPRFQTMDECLSMENSIISNSVAGLRETAQILRNKSYQVTLDPSDLGSGGGIIGYGVSGELQINDQSQLRSEIEDEVEKLSTKKAQDKIDAQLNEQEADSREEFKNFKLGIGIAFTKLHGTSIEDLDIRDGQIVVEKERSHRGNFMLETHKFFTPQWLNRQVGADTVGIGPFITVSIADTDGGDPFSSYGVGLMAGFKDRQGGGSWNIGFGYFVETKAQKLRSGVSEGDTTTVTDTDDLLVERDQGGIMLIVSTSWD